MSAATATKPRLLCVDDEPEVLDSMKVTLRRDFKITTAESGPEALALFDQASDGVPFDAVLSDMRMPGMTGAQLLSDLRDRHPDMPRLLLTGQADLDSAIAAINEAKVFRFLTKPCPPGLIAEAVNESLEQARLRKVEKELLANTLSGAVSMLTEVLGLVSTDAFARTQRLHKVVSNLCQAIGAPVDWDLNVAAMLSQLGFVVLPPNPARRSTGGAEPAHAQQAADLVTRVPRLEGVAEMIRHQLDPAPASKGLRGDNLHDPALKQEILRVAVRYDAYLAGGLTHSQAVDRLRKADSPPPELLIDGLSAMAAGEEPMVPIKVNLGQLASGMMLNGDLMLSNGSKLAGVGTPLTSVLVGRIKAFADTVGVEQPIDVMAPASIAAKLRKR